MANKLIYKLHENPLVAAIHNEKDAEYLITTDVTVAFILDTDIFEVEKIVEILRQKKIMLFLHFDLLNGISKNDIGLKYIKERIKPDGIITTRADIIGLAKKEKIYVIQRVFLLDSISLNKGIKSINEHRPDAVEILPGIMHDITEKISKKIDSPLIVGGLIESKKDVIKCLNANAMGISTSDKAIWNQ